MPSLIMLLGLLCSAFAAIAQPGTEVRVAAISFMPEKLGLEKNVATLTTAFRTAAAGGAKIAVAPEGALDGYVINEIIAGKLTQQQLKSVAIAIDDPIIQRFQKLAQELKLCLAFGFAERIGEEIFNCACFIDHDGKIAGKYHKMQFAEGYDSAWWWNRLGAKSRAFETPYGRAGFMICNDRWNPELARIPTLDGAQFLMIPAFGSRSQAQDEAVRSRARENSIPVIEANVGVTLIVDQAGNVISQDRQEVAITFGSIEIPGTSARNTQARDQVEATFLTWRAEEMARRLKK